jgi:hypothetical protein
MPDEFDFVLVGAGSARVLAPAERARLDEIETRLVPRVIESAVILWQVGYSSQHVWSILDPAISATQGTRPIR